MGKLFLDVLGNKELVDGYQIEDSIALKYDLKPGSKCPFTGLRVEMLSPQQVLAAEKAGRQKIIPPRGKTPGKEKRNDTHPAEKKKSLSADHGKVSVCAADKKATTKGSHPGESYDFARGRARTGRSPVKRNRIFEREEVHMATEKKVPATPAKAPAKAKAAVKAPAKAAAKPAKAAAKTVAKAPAKAKAKVQAPAKAKAVAKKAVAKKPVAKKAVAKKPAAKK